MNRIILLICCLGCTFLAYAQDTVYHLTLSDCRRMALEQSLSTQMRTEALEAATLNEKAALAAMFPKFSANAAYAWNSKSPHLLADRLAFDFGTATVGPDGSASFQWSEDSYMEQIIQATQSFPEVNEQVSAIADEAGQMVADIYGRLYKELSPDLTHVFVAQVGVTQPIYVGGRLIELYRIAKATRQIAEIEASNKDDDKIIAVDEAYWRVVAVTHKKDLADQYFNLVETLEREVTAMNAEGLATQSELLKVKAQRGEAEVKKMQATNGLILAKMALAQCIGLPLDARFTIDDAGIESFSLHTDSLSESADMVDARAEIQLMEQAVKIAESNVKIMAAGLQPNILAQANYIYSNPSVENGFNNQWKSTGFFSAGVVVNIPIAHADDILRLKAAKHEARLVALKKDEARELLSLQLTQAHQKVLESQQKVTMTEMQLRNAEEVLRFAQQAFDAGLATATDLMQAQTAWLAASSDKIDAQVEAQVVETYFRKYTNSLDY